jgi:ketosteroid isomerase-like protein
VSASANVDLVRFIFVTFARGDFTRALEWAHPEIEFVISDGPSPGCWRGLSGLTAGWYGFLAAWEDFRVEVDEYREIDSERVLVLNRFGGRGKTSGLDIWEMQAKGANLYRIDDGKVTRIVFYFDRERALDDLGLAGEHGSPGT